MKWEVWKGLFRDGFHKPWTAFPGFSMLIMRWGTVFKITKQKFHVGRESLRFIKRKLVIRKCNLSSDKAWINLPILTPPPTHFYKILWQKATVFIRKNVTWTTKSSCFEHLLSSQTNFWCRDNAPPVLPKIYWRQKVPKAANCKCSTALRKILVPSRTSNTTRQQEIKETQKN